MTLFFLVTNFLFSIPFQVITPTVGGTRAKAQTSRIDVWIVVDIVVKTWRREILVGTKLWFFGVVFESVLCGKELDVSREAAD